MSSKKTTADCWRIEAKTTLDAMWKVAAYFMPVRQYCEPAQDMMGQRGCFVAFVIVNFNLLVPSDSVHCRGHYCLT